MSKIKKTNSNKSNVAKRSKGTSKYTLKAWYIVAGLALFIAGGFIVAYSQAATETMALEKAEPIVFYQDNDVPVQIEKTNNTPIQQRGPKIIQLSAEGDLYCFNKNSEGGNNRKMNPSEVSGLLTELQSTNINHLSTPISESGSISSKSITFINPTTKKSVNINLLGPNGTAPGITKAITILEKACATNNKPATRLDIPSRNKSTSYQGPTSANGVASYMVGVARAAEYTNYNNDFTFTLLGLIQNARTSRGLPAFVVHSCLNKSAADWSNQMAVRYNTVVQNTGTRPGDFIIWHSNLQAQIPAFCGGGWTSLGENVGWDHASAKGISAQQAAQSMFTNYMNSPPHRDQILGRATFVGVGSTLTSNKETILNATHFASGNLVDVKAAATK
ncbi:hypothetical protein IPM44_03290 [bacterium]|nr:MAG: hypothetical protein IPM44_03290 [bacterium]